MVLSLNGEDTDRILMHNITNVFKLFYLFVHSTININNIVFNPLVPKSVKMQKWTTGESMLSTVGEKIVNDGVQNVLPLLP